MADRQQGSYRTIKAIPMDQKGHWLREHGTEICTKEFTGVDSSTGDELELGVDCKCALIWCNSGANAWTFAGTNSTDNDALTVPWPGIAVNIVSPASTSLGTVKAVSGTVTISVLYVR